MSVPVLLTLLDTNTAAQAASAVNDLVVPAAASLRMEDEQLKNCASYVDVASVTGFVNAPKIDANAEQTLLLNAADNELKSDTTTTTANTACLPSLHTFSVQLDFQLQPYEFVGLTGETKALGEWRLEQSIELQREIAENNIWSANVLLPCLNEPTAGLSYRYFIYTKDAMGRKQIRRWETHLQPRRLLTHQLNEVEAQLPDRFGVIDGMIDGMIDNDNEAKHKILQVKRGWLTTETIVQFKFERERMFRVRDVNKFDAEHIQIKVEPLVKRSEHFVEVHVDVARLSYGESHLQQQPPSGAAYRRGDVLIFHLTVVDMTSNGYNFTFYTPAGQLVGTTEIKPEMLVGSEGELHLDISSEAKVVAQLTLPYVVVRPYANAKLLDFRTTYAHYWPKSWPKLDVGHRGNGKSYVHDPPAERENTLASFMRAYESHADMIELDVHLTADGVPIIYHDFGVYTAPLGKQVHSREQLEHVLIKDLDYEAIKNLRVFAVIKGEVVEYPAHNAEPRFDHRIFPRLYDVLANLPKSLGIDVEIKWPQRTACGGVEALQSIDKNLFVDRVLDTIIQYGCGRPLIFSSFDADICTMLRFKQNIFPVMFLTQGETKKWSPFMDLRTRNFVQAINNAQAFELAGTAPHAEDFLGEHGAALMQKAVQAGQIAVVWGDDVNSKERIKYFSTIGATAICYDRADLFVPEQKERAFFNSSDLIAEFEAQCPAATTTTTATTLTSA